MTQDQFLQNIIVNPDNDAPRLIYADWLEEQGSVDRAEHIRVQCELARLPRYDLRKSELQARERRLLVEHIPEWWHDYEISGPFRRGFVESLVFHSPEEFLERADEAFASGPIEHLTFIAQNDEWTSDAIEEVKACQLLERIRSIYIETDFPGNAVLSVLSSPHLTNLETLEMEGGEFLQEDEFAEVVTEARDTAGWPERLKKLALSYDELSPSTIQFLVDSQLLSNCRSLRLQNGDNLSFQQLDTLLSVCEMSELRELEFQANLTDENAAKRVVQKLFVGNIKRLAINLPFSLLGPLPHLGKVEELCLYRWQYSTIDDLPRCSNFQQLQRLDLPYCDLEPEGIQVLAECPQVENLQALSLVGNSRIGNDGARVLAQSRYLQNLRVLDISSSGIQEIGLQDIIQEPFVQHLRLLRVSGTSDYSGSIYQELARSPWLKNLTSLELPWGTRANPDLEVFLASDNLPLLTHLPWGLLSVTLRDLERLVQSTLAWAGVSKATWRRHTELYRSYYLPRFGEHFDGYRHMEWRELFFPDNGYLE